MRRAPLLLMLVMACGKPPAPSTPAPAPPKAGAQPSTLPLELRWVRNSAEHRAAYVQAYHTGATRLAQMAPGLPTGGWAVILDADETVLDNSLYQKRLFENHEQHSEAKWEAWVAEGVAPALPGAVEFTAAVRKLGGKVVIVTNRPGNLCGVTQRTVANDSITTDQVICRQTDDPNEPKEPRFDAVTRGTPPSTLPPLKVVMFIGDNIRDFPNQRQAIRFDPDSAFAAFGVEWIVLPNPMYGSWMGNPDM